MRVCNVELNESNSKYADYLKWFASLDYEDQKREFLDKIRKHNEDFSAYAMGKKKRIKYGDAVEKFMMIDRYLTANNLVDKF